MGDTMAFDRQLGDFVWLFTMALRAGYSVRQCFERFAKLDIEPTASVFKAWVEDMNAGTSVEQGFVNLQKTYPSPHMARVIAVMQKQREAGGNLAFMLEPVGQEILDEVGTDKALFPEMRETAKQLGAKVPERVLES